MGVLFRTNLFEYNDKKRINEASIAHNVEMADNGNKVALIAKNIEDIICVFDDCFDKYTFTVDGDVVLLNMDCDKK